MKPVQGAEGLSQLGLGPAPALPLPSRESGIREGAPIPCAQHRGARGKPHRIRIKPPPGPPGCSPPHPAAPAGTTMEPPMVPNPPPMGKLRLEPAQTGAGFMDGRELHPSTPSLSLGLKWVFGLGFLGLFLCR